MKLLSKLAAALVLALAGVGAYVLLTGVDRPLANDDCGSRQDEEVRQAGLFEAGSGAGVPPQAPPAVQALVEDAPDTLVERGLVIPVEGVRRIDLIDTFEDKRGEFARHEAIDIMAKAGTPVYAVDDGTIRKLFLSEKGGITVYHFGPAEKYCFYYAHLDRYASGLAEGQRISKGDLIGYVGSSGNASPDAPHLHFGITELGPEKQWWGGEPVNPFPILAAGRDAPAD